MCIYMVINAVEFFLFWRYQRVINMENKLLDKSFQLQDIQEQYQESKQALSEGGSMLDLVKSIGDEDEEDKIDLSDEKVKVLLNFYIQQRQDEYSRDGSSEASA